MRILALASWWPEPADNGSRLRTLSLLRALSSVHEVHLRALCQDPVELLQRAQLDRLCASVAAVQRRTYRPHRADLVTSLWHPEPAFFRATWTPAYAALVQQAAALRPHAVVAFELSAAPYALLLARVPRILEGLEVSSLYHGQARTQGLRQLRAWLTWTKHRDYVARLLRSFAAYTVVSESELALVRRLAPFAQGEVIPNGAEVAPVGGPVVTPDPDTLIYPGALTFDANLDAMSYFLAEIFPGIRARRPRTTIRITGRAEAAQIAALPPSAGVDLTGVVPDVRALIARTHAEVVPLRKGGGTRLKVLEAMALGTPVISTSKGVEGIDVVAGEHVLLADTPSAFRDATICVLEQPELRQRLADAARRLVQRSYDWQAIGPRLLALVAEVVRPDAAAGEERP